MSRRDCPAYNGMVTRIPAPFAFLPGRLTLPPDWNPNGHMMRDGEWVEVNRLGFWVAVEFDGHLVPLAPYPPTVVGGKEHPAQKAQRSG